MILLKKLNRSLRIDPSNPDHHLWNNNGTWWVHYTEWLENHTARRVRRSLGTACRSRARALRDALLLTGCLS
jgi:hypothetical protein